MKTSPCKTYALLAAALFPLAGFAQVNSGSDGHDGALNPTSNLVIDMADHPDGIYHYTSVNIPAGVTVSFIPNAGNKPVVWLVQGDCVSIGRIDHFRLSRRQSWLSGPRAVRGWSRRAGGLQRSEDSGPGRRWWRYGTAVGGNASYWIRSEVKSRQITISNRREVYGNIIFACRSYGGSGGGGSNSNSRAVVAGAAVQF